MAKHRTTWIVIADGTRASILKRREVESGFDVIARMESAEAHVPNREIMADRPGRTQESASSVHHAIEPRSDAHELRKLAFVDRVADYLAEADKRSAFDRLTLIAPARTLGELQHRLSAGTAAKVGATLAKDLTQTPLSELDRHLADLPHH